MPKLAWMLVAALVPVLALALACKSEPRPQEEHHVSPLAAPPVWSELDRFQDTITREELVSLLDRVYTQESAYKSFISVLSDHAVIRTSSRDPERVYKLRLASASSRPGAQPSSKRESRVQAKPSRQRPLEGLRFAIDPGHIGGQWAKLEWRWFQIGNAGPVAEGDLNLLTAHLLADRLREHGAQVTLIRSEPRPVTEAVPSDFEAIARKLLIERRELHPGLSAAQEMNMIREESVLLAYRTSEIRARAERVNELAPDLTICIHFDAAAWEDAARPSLTSKNHLHFLVHGAYTADELAYEDMRFHLLHKLLSRNHETEMAVSRAVASAMAEATGLRAEDYPRTSRTAIRLSPDGYIWARNLLANRIYRGPVLYIEAYVMNDHQVFARLQAGDYAGLRYIAGKEQPSIFREYADSVARGLVDYYTAQAAMPRRDHCGVVGMYGLPCEPFAP